MLIPSNKLNESYNRIEHHIQDYRDSHDPGLSAGTQVLAEIITITNTNDSGPGSLRNALAIATDGDEITFAVTGTIGLTSGELPVNHSISISGPGAVNLAVNGNAKSRVFHISSGTTVTISGLTITNGNANGQSYPDDSGGGVYNDHANGTLSNCTITNNQAVTFGGGIYNDHSSLTLDGCAVSGNFSDNTGGGIYNDGDSVMTVTASSLFSNTGVSIFSTAARCR